MSKETIGLNTICSISKGKTPFSSEFKRCDKGTISIFGELLNKFHREQAEDISGDLNVYDTKENLFYSEEEKMIYNKVMTLAALYTGIQNLLKCPPNSSAMEGMHAGIKRFLLKFYKLVADLNTEISRQKRTDKEKRGAPLRRALVWSREYSGQLDYTLRILTSCQGLRGCEVLSCLSRFACHGDPRLSAVATGLFHEATYFYCKMIWIWLILGSLKDPYNEFFVAENILRNDSWENKYFLRQDVIPSQISIQSARLVLECGKMINFILNICEEPAPLSKTRQYFLRFQNEPHCGLLTLVIGDDRIIINAIRHLLLDYSRNILSILKSKYNLDRYFMGHYWYTFLALGNFGRYFLELIYPQYKSKAEGQEINYVKKLLKQAVLATSPYHLESERSSEAKFIDVNWENVVENDKLGDVLQITYDRGSPLREAFSCLENLHQKLSSTVWKIHQMQFSLRNQKKTLIALEKKLQNRNGDEDSLRTTFRLVADLNQFVNHISFYIMHEVIELEWKKFWKKYQQAETINEVMNFYNVFLNEVSSRILEDFNKEMHIAVNLIHNVIKELEQGIYETEELVKNKQLFNKDRIRAEATIFYKSFKDAVNIFLSSSRNDDGFDFLCSRINFNNFFTLQ